MVFDTYRTIAEVAVTLTGFIGVVVVLKRRDEHFSRLGLATIMSTSLGAVLFAFLPELLSGVFSEAVTWRLANGSFGLYHLYLILWHQFRQRSIRSNTPVQWVVVFLSFWVVGLKLAVGLGHLLAYAYGIYLLGLLWLIGVAGYLFTMILFDDRGRD